MKRYAQQTKLFSPNTRVHPDLFFAPFGHEFRPFWLFEIVFLPVFGDLKGLFRAEDENSPLLDF